MTIHPCPQLGHAALRLDYARELPGSLGFTFVLLSALSHVPLMSYLSPLRLPLNKTFLWVEVQDSPS